MPTLNWIGKEPVVNHHQQVPFRLLKDVPDLACVCRMRVPRAILTSIARMRFRYPIRCRTC